MPFPLLIFLFLCLLLFVPSSHFFLLTDVHFFLSPQKKYNRATCCLQFTKVFSLLQLSKWRLKLFWPRRRGGSWTKKILPWHQNVPTNCWHFPTKTRGAVFHQIPGDFCPSAKSEFNVWFLRCIKAFCESQKNSLYS
jgi:hypothetical protein